jgi:hypothetical protein
MSPSQLKMLNIDGGNVKLASEDIHKLPAGAVVDLNRILGLSARTFRFHLNYVCSRPGTSSYSYYRPHWTPSHDDKNKARVFISLGFTDAYKRNEEGAKASSVTPSTHPINSLEVDRMQYSSYYGNTIPGVDSREWRVFVTLGDVGGISATIIMDFKVAEKAFGLKITEDAQLSAQGKTFVFPAAPKLLEKQYTGAPAIAFSLIGDNDSLNNLLRHSMKTKDFPKQALKGITKTWTKVSPLADAIKVSHPLTFLAFRNLVTNASRTVDKVRVSVVFNRTFKDVTTSEQLVEALEPLKGTASGSNFDASLKKMPAFTAHRKKVLKGQANRAFSKRQQDMEFLTVLQAEHPLTHAAIENGDIPITTFFRKKEQYFLLNDNWKLWELMLQRHRKTTIALAKEVAGRSTYEKDLMSYFYFLLFALPEYLQQHTGRKWICQPKLINNSADLEKSEADADGITRTRSAMTPTVDNEAGIVTVPYIAVCMRGYRSSTWCYSHNYTALTRGLSINGNTVMSDLEEKLNGKDDYGLMFYTLVGTERGTGYPTFLIIFERLKTGTRVHFHRVHPSRSKDGDYNPVHAWTKNCYNWMAGNVRRDRIATSQGDLMFLTVDDEKAKKLTLDGSVNNYDSHTFEVAVAHQPSTSKKEKNLLGYVKLAAPTKLKHPEHEDRLLDTGVYEIRQARSFEANPSGSWSMTVD